MISGLEKFMSLPALFLIYVLALIQTNHSAYSYNEASSCYDYRNKPVRCSPDFINAAYNRTIMSSNTCGMIKFVFAFELFILMLKFPIK